MVVDPPGLLRQLVSQPSPLGRDRTLLEVLDLLQSEEAHSALLAWLMATNGPVGSSALLRRLWATWLPTQTWPGDEYRVSTEVPCGRDRADIVIDWADFRLLIENKVWSAEGEDQVPRYLASFDILADRGRLIFLSPRGGAPPSMRGPLDERVVPSSYDTLIDALEAVGTDASLSPRGTLFIREYHRSLLRLLSKRVTMDETPTLSESSALFVQHFQHIEKLRCEAARESGDVIAWLARQVAGDLRAHGAEEMPARDHAYAYLFRRPAWQVGDVEFGWCYSAEGKIGKSILPEHPHCVGIRVQPITTSPAGSAQRRVALAIAERVRGTLERERDVSFTNTYWPVYRAVPFKPGMSVPDWQSAVRSELWALAERTRQLLDTVAEELRASR